MTQSNARQGEGFGPKCPAGDKCENRIFLEEYERVDHEYARQLVRELAAARVQVNDLQLRLTLAMDPDEERHDGERVRKDRWETGIRNIASALGWGQKGFEVGDVVAAVKKLLDDQRAADAAVGKRTNAARPK